MYVTPTIVAPLRRVIDMGVGDVSSINFAGFAQALRRGMQNQGLNQKGLAAAANYDAGALSRLLNGQVTELPEFANVCRLADAAGLPLAELAYAADLPAHWPTTRGEGNTRIVSDRNLIVLLDLLDRDPVATEAATRLAQTFAIARSQGKRERD